MKKFLIIICTVSATVLYGQSPQPPKKQTAIAKKTSVIVPKQGSLLQGTFGAPSGTNVVLQNNAKNDLTLSAQEVKGMTVSQNNFRFPNAIPDGSAFKVTVKKAAAAQTVGIYAGGEGTMPQTAGMLKVGADFTYDLVSRGSDASFGSFYSTFQPDIGGGSGEEGRYIVFVSNAELIVGNTGKHRQVFWRDRNAGITKLISAAPGGAEGDGDSIEPSISADGKTVAFESYSTNLVESDKNSARDIFVWHAATNTIELVSVGVDGKQSNGDSYRPSVSGDGNLIAFTSSANNISATAKGTADNNVFLRDCKLGTTVMISIDPVLRKGGGGANPSISQDGNRIAFCSSSGTLAANDNNGLWDIFLWEKDNAALKRVSLTADGKERNQGIESASRSVSSAISGNGRYIVYATTATNMLPGIITSQQQIYVYDTNTGITVIASTGADKKPANGDSPVTQGEKIAISYDGNWLAFPTKATNMGVPVGNIVMRNMSTGVNRAISSVAGREAGRPVISTNGSYVVFGIGDKLDSRFPSSGIFASYTGVGPCRACPE